MRRAFSLIEIILVLALIGLAAALLAPSLNTAFSVYHLGRAGEDLQFRLAQTRLQAMETGVPFAFSYRPEQDQFMTWAVEPLSIYSTQPGQIPESLASAIATGDAYDRHFYELNDRADNREFRFLSSDPSEPLATMGLGRDAQAGLSPTAAQAIASSSLLSGRKLALAAPSTRSMAALQIPGLQLGDAAVPLVFEPDGTADRDAVIRIADRSGRFIEVTVQGLTGAISSSSVLTAEDAMASGTTVQPASEPRTGFVTPSRSRELRTGDN